MRTCILVVLMSLGSFSCLAQDSAAYRACSKQATTQHDMNGCVNEEAKRINDELHKVYKLLLTKVSGDALATAKIRAAEKAWTAYRDAYIEAMYPAKDKQAEYGSIFPMEVDLLGAKLTRQQISALRDILRENDPQ